MNYCKVCGAKCGNKYIVCFEHKDTKYKDKCKIHGVTTFINRQCQKCKKLKTPEYEIKNKKDRFGKTINKNHFLYPYLDRLTNKDLAYQKQFIQRISCKPGVYGIFHNNTCLYVGQSVNISNRINQHKEAFKKAQKQLQGIRIRKKRIHLDKVPRKVEYKYYELANNYKLGDLKFKKLFDVPRLKDDFEFSELLTYAEQAMMDVYDPKINLMAARPTKEVN